MKSLARRISGITLAAGVALAVLASTAFASAEWSQDYAKSLSKAQAEKKLVLLDFTGSDWCVWCMKLDKEVFSTSDFKSYAKDHLVLVKLDFPQKAQLKKIQMQNQALQARYNVEAFPTVLILNSEGKTVGELSYEGGGAKAFLATLEKIKN